MDLKQADQRNMLTDTAEKGNSGHGLHLDCACVIRADIDPHETDIGGAVTCQTRCCETMFEGGKARGR